MEPSPRRLATLSASLFALFVVPEETPFERARQAAERALSVKNLHDAQQYLQRALERDPKSLAAWDLRARVAAAAGDKDEQVFSLHTCLRLQRAARAPKDVTDATTQQIRALDPLIDELLLTQKRFLERLVPVAERYEKQGRRHSAIRTHRLILALAPERVESETAIQRIAAAPDPSLAESAKPKDLLADVSDEWIRDHDLKHSGWDTRARMERENYFTHTDAGYAVLVRAAEAMEQMNAFYRQFFRYGTPEDGKSVPRIDLNIFKNRDEYLKLGIGPPVEWSGGHFTGNAVETYVGAGGFEEMVGTLFHEAAHQFVSLATNAAGWLNEGLASYFEGTRILANGTVVMNLPANHRLFPLAQRMEKGWMASSSDGIDPKDPSKSDPEKAPTFRIVVENDYAWGPPWYAPTWGVVYFLYNYQDPLDGRFVYRNSLWDFVNSSGGRSGKGAIENFEKTVLGNPQPLTPKVDAKLAKKALKLPKTIDELDEVWKEWLLNLRDEQSGRAVAEKPFLAWGKYAIARKDFAVAAEHFEKGALARPTDAELLLEYAKLLAGPLKNTDRAARLALQAGRVAEAATPPNTALAQQCDRMLEQWEPGYASIDRLQRDLAASARSLSRRYLDAGISMVAMDSSFRLAAELDLPSLYQDYEEAAARGGKSLAIWKLAYNEKNLAGWNTPGNEVFKPNGERLEAKLGDYDEKRFDYQFLTLDEVTSGDFSMETELLAETSQNSFCGIVFGRKSSTTFHAAVLFPARKGAENGFVDLTSFYGGDANKIWRHNPVKMVLRTDGTAASAWHRLRVDVTGTLVDVWFDGALVATQDFGSLDVLRGSFGLLTGPGSAQFRNVRFLSRSSKDKSGAVERALRMAKQPKQLPGEGGVWLGAVPPFPQVGRWVQNPRASWSEKGAVPTVVVFWSIEQNEALPIDGWLRDLHGRMQEVGLEVVSICSYVGTTQIEGYLSKHIFPGSVAVDLQRSGLGATMDLFRLSGFGLPRVLLLDLDGRVLWEGDPGFKRGEPWVIGMPSYLDAPLDELITKRKLKDLSKWRQEWNASGRPALAAGNVASAAALLAQAKTLPGDVDPVVAEAQGKLSAVDGALGALDGIAASFAERRAEPAIAVLGDWAKALGRPLDARAKKCISDAASSQNAKAWALALETLRLHRPRMTAGKELEVAAQAADKIDDLDGAFPAALAQEMHSLIGYQDLAGLVKLLDEADRIPAKWLASRFFYW